VDNEDDLAWNYLLQGTLDGPDSPNNVISEEITIFMKEKL